MKPTHLRKPLPPLANLSAEEFLEHYWQKKPLLIRQAFPDFEAHLSPEELAGLACEDEVESRIVLENGKTPWELKHGPFSEEDFLSLPPSHWTLLVQGVEQWVPEVYQLLERFRFIPQWRLDDIMISYATTGGSVGPHFDYYDVFLLQAKGKRQWQIGQHCSADAPKLPNTPLYILKNFQTTDTWELAPGDMLYLPPQWAHHGTALDDECMTYSVGFRAPSHGDILQELSFFLSQKVQASTRYQDPDLSVLSSSAQIPSSAVKKIHQIFREKLNDESSIAQWFGEYMTQPKVDLYIPDVFCTKSDSLGSSATQFFQDLQDTIKAGNHIERSPQTRLAFYELENCIQLFVNGQCITLPSTECYHIEFLSEQTVLSPESVLQQAQSSPMICRLWQWLINQSLFIMTTSS